MGKPRGKTKKLNDESDQEGSSGGGGEEVSMSPTPTPPKTKRRRGRPAHKPLNKDDDGTDDVVEAEDDKDTGEVEEDADAKPVVRHPKGSTHEGGAAKKKRRRRRVKRSSSDDDAVGEDGVVGEGHVRRAKSSGRGFRPDGSRRKNTPRRAAEAGVECK